MGLSDVDQLHHSLWYMNEVSLRVLVHAKNRLTHMHGFGVLLHVFDCDGQYGQ